MGELTFDDILKELGELGKFQLLSYLLLCISSMVTGLNYVSYVFIAGVPSHSCKEPVCEYGTSFKNKTCDNYVRGKHPTVANIWKIESCAEFNQKLTLVGNINFAFKIIGGFLFGSLSDRFGRKQMYLVSAFIMFVGGVSRIICTNYKTFLFMTAIYAFGISGIYPISFVLGIELVGRSKRESTAVIFNIFFAVGIVLLGVVAYLTEDWVNTQLIVSSPALLFMSYFFFVPESIRWLMAKGRAEEVFLVISKAAKINNVKISNDTMMAIKALANREYEFEEANSKIKPTLKHLLRTRKLILRYCIVFYIWIVIAFIYHFISITATNMVGNPYLNFILISLIEIPSYVFSWTATYKLGRKYPLLFCIASVAICAIINIFLKDDMKWVKMGISLTIKVFATGAYQIIYIYTAEIYPTIVRSIGVNTSSTLAKLGGLLASFIPITGAYLTVMPGIIIAVVSIIAVLLIFLIPETKNQTLPDTVEEAIDL